LLIKEKWHLKAGNKKTHPTISWVGFNLILKL